LVGYPEGVYRVGPLARLNAADRCGTPEADKELEEYRQRFSRIVQSGFHYHYARLIEATYALERMKQLLDDPAILSTKVRATGGVNDPELGGGLGAGTCEGQEFPSPAERRPEQAAPRAATRPRGAAGRSP
jgi:coenzyme F420-reducing hydrogenase alpha subunit